MPADPLPVWPEALKPLWLRASEAEYGDLYRAFTAMPNVIALLLLCGLCWWIVCYRHLNPVRFEVILAIEARLPLAPYTEEWQALCGRKELRRHLPLSSVEKMVPLLFVLLYAALSLMVFLSGQPAADHHAG